MDLDFLSKILGGQGAANNPMTSLLPLLLGGKAPDLSSFFGKAKAGGSDGDFPPLFGNPSTAQSAEKGLVNLLGNLFPSGNNPAPTPKATFEYPYELQYNRPFSSKK